MAMLAIVPTRGNAGGRLFPASGLLALTPVKVEGIVRARVPDGQRALPARCIDVAVRCYEDRVGRFGGTQSHIVAEYRQVLWEKAPASDYEDIGDKDLPFKIVVPRRTHGPSTQNYQNYRVYWRIETTFTHLPMAGFGTKQVKGFELALTRFDVPKPTRPPGPPSYSTTRGSRSLSLQHLLSLPSSAVGPLDIIPVSVRVRPLGDDHAEVSRVALSVQRRLTIHDAPLASDAATSLTPAGALAMDRGRDSLSLMSSSASDVALLGSRLDASPQASSSSSSKPSCMTVSTVDATAIPRDDTDFYMKTLYISLPPAKSNNHWALGETLNTHMASVRFYVLVRVTVLLSNGHQEYIDLPPQELLVSATNASERQSLETKYPELFEKRSPRRRSENSPSRHPPKSAGDSSSPPIPTPKPRKSRRPHTAAGDSPHHHDHDSGPSHSRRFERPPSSEASTRPVPPPLTTQQSYTSSTASLVQPITPPRCSSESARVRVTPATEGDVRAWEAELERIEARSRQRSAEQMMSASGLAGRKGVKPLTPQHMSPIAVSAT